MQLGLGCDLQYRYFLKDEFIAETIRISQLFIKSPVTNKNAPHIKVEKKNLFPSSIDGEPSPSASIWRL
jgi:hypothetical protein